MKEFVFMVIIPVALGLGIIVTSDHLRCGGQNVNENHYIFYPDENGNVNCRCNTRTGTVETYSYSGVSPRGWSKK